MNYNYDDERPGEFPQSGDTPERGAQDVAGEDILPEASGIPGFYTPHAEYDEVTAEPRREAAAELSPEAQYETAGYTESVKPQPWRDPAYSAVPEHDPNVYSPGISPSYQPKHRPERMDERRGEPEVLTGGGRRRGGGFIRAACLVVVCALASAAATLGVLEYKSGDTDSTPPTEQTESAGNADNRPGSTANQPPAAADSNDQNLPSNTPGVVTQPMINPGMVLAAQDIYEMACQQVVVIKTNVTGQSGYFSSSSLISGSGFIIREDGYIVTNYHVVESAYINSSYEMTVTLNNGDVYPAVIIGVEPSSDIAVIKIDAEGLSPVAVGDSAVMRVGESVYAVGNPLGDLVYTITDGIVSALDREITVEGVTMNMFQISAAVNSGNSGGPVYDTYGRVLGVVTAKFSNSAVEGIGFAIPINEAMRIASQLMNSGYIYDSKAYLGITVITVDSATADYYDWVVGAYVRSVVEGSCADKAGLKVGDIITKVGDITVTSQESLIYAKKCFNAGDTTELMVRRAGEDMTLTITFDTEPEVQETAENPDTPTSQEVPFGRVEINPNP